MGRLDDKVAVILGASDERSIGAATARRFVSEGGKVVLAARGLEGVQKVAEQTGGIAVACDITNESDLANLAKTAKDNYGRVDVGVNYAGANFHSSISDGNANDFRKASEIHFVGPAMFFKHMAKEMTDGGSLITTSSLTVLTAQPGLSAYAGSKAATDQMVRIAAVELGGQNIRVNAIAPGLTKTAMTETYFEMEGLRRGYLKEIPLGRFSTVDDIANAALWLASDEAFITGQVLDITGGQSLRRLPRPDEIA